MHSLGWRNPVDKINKARPALYIVCIMLRAMWTLEVVLCCWVYLLWLKHQNLSLSRLRVGLRLHWGAGIDVACRLCMHYIDDLLPYAQLCSYWGCGQGIHLDTTQGCKLYLPKCSRSSRSAAAAVLRTLCLSLGERCWSNCTSAEWWPLSSVISILTSSWCYAGSYIYHTPSSNLLFCGW